MRKRKASRTMPWGTEKILLPVMSIGNYVLLFKFVFSFMRLEVTEFLPYGPVLLRCWKYILHKMKSVLLWDLLLIGDRHKCVINVSDVDKF